MKKESEKEESDLVYVAKAICGEENLSFEDWVGTGSFKKVFRVSDKEGGLYALKIIIGSTHDPRTIREIDALKKCDHPNIGKLIKVGNHLVDAKSYDYMVEEFLPGGTLTSKLEEVEKLSIKEINNLGITLINAISHIATLRIVHRDIKPDNIMFREDGKTPVLVDFGIARDLSKASLTKTWQMRGPGTPYFAAPEQLNNRKRLIDWRTDQFSLGIVLCFSHVGLHPYQYTDEHLFSPLTVDRVASWGKQDSEIIDKCNKEGFTCIEKMTKAWPVERFRHPDDLEMAWQNQGVE